MEFISITLDYDIENYGEKELLNNLYAILKNFDSVFIRHSASGDNYHVRIDLDYVIDFDLLIKYRQKYGDDEIRINLDKERREMGSKILNVLFDEKDGQKAGEWVRVSNTAELTKFMNER